MEIIQQIQIIPNKPRKVKVQATANFSYEGLFHFFGIENGCTVCIIEDGSGQLHSVRISSVSFKNPVGWE
jgi:hypothetical protein